VHTVGLLLEDNYKDVVHSQSLGDLAKNIQSAIRGQNPLEKGKTSKTELTYEKINRDTGMFLKYELLLPLISKTIPQSTHMAHFP